MYIKQNHPPAYRKGWRNLSAVYFNHYLIGGCGGRGEKLDQALWPVKLNAVHPLCTATIHPYLFLKSQISIKTRKYIQPFTVRFVAGCIIRSIQQGRLQLVSVLARWNTEPCRARSHFYMVIHSKTIAQ